MSEELYRAMYSRRSVRKYETNGLDAAMMERVRGFTSSMTPLFPEIRTELRTLGPDDVKGMFKVTAPHYLAIYSEKKEGDAANAGFLLQQADLFLSANGLGSCWQGGPKPTGNVPEVPGLDFVIMLAFGRAAEDVHRTSVTQFKRKPLEEICTVQGYDDILGAARIAPSGMNNQSWFFTGGEGMIHAYAARSLITDRMNRVNVGIALCHMWLAAEHENMKNRIMSDPRGLEKVPGWHSYVASMVLGD
ncbi:MAG: hypothetical protein ISF22_03605 [Methanomassiliicoccus sp.]|nr:hypothetical protein [Methanomassiliicoccus sp.]